MPIIVLSGQDPKLYGLVGPLVMDPAVLKWNNNYPFKTSRDYTWHIAVRSNEVLGFIPVYMTGNKVTINNYYVRDDDPEIFDELLEDVTACYWRDKMIESVAQSDHVNYFRKNGFTVMFFWKKYVKMEYAPGKN